MMRQRTLAGHSTVDCHMQDHRDLDNLAAALQRYGMHRMGCDRCWSWGKSCTCGFQAVLDAIGGDHA